MHFFPVNYPSGHEGIQSGPPVVTLNHDFLPASRLNSYPFGGYVHFTPPVDHLANHFPEGPQASFFHTLLENPLHPLYQPRPGDLPPLPQSSPPNQEQSFQHPASVSLLETFKNKDGTLDINKMISTAGQFLSVVDQFSSLIKGFSQMIKK